eukprot:scaffold20879_cov197-Skeletonema_marinoi.AAC.3
MDPTRRMRPDEMNFALGIKDKSFAYSRHDQRYSVVKFGVFLTPFLGHTTHLDMLQLILLFDVPLLCFLLHRCNY